MLDYRTRRQAANERWMARKSQIAEAKANATETVRFQEQEQRKPITVNVDGELVAMDDRDSKAFKLYVAVVESVLKEANGSLLTIGEIKIALGDRLVERWLFDALATSFHVLHVPAYIDRFAYVEKVTIRNGGENKNIQVAGTAKHKGPDWPIA